jgi:ribosomal protein S18 acetylase RimI-like enzyme
MDNEIKIKQIDIVQNRSIVEELVGALHVSELELNPKTARWSDIKDEYLQHMMECENEANGKFFLATTNELLIGFIFGYVEEKGNSNFEIGDGDDLYISEGYVLESFRNQGVYRKLNEAFIESYTNIKLRRIIRYTLSNNKKMQQWLEHKGYNAVRVVYEKWL